MEGEAGRGQRTRKAAEDGRFGRAASTAVSLPAKSIRFDSGRWSVPAVGYRRREESGPLSLLIVNPELSKVPRLSLE